MVEFINNHLRCSRGRLGVTRSSLMWWHHCRRLLPVAAAPCSATKDVLFLLHGGCLAGPDAHALRLLLLAELVSAAGFERDRLYVEWQLHFDPEQWVLPHSEQEVVQPGLIQVRVFVCRMSVIKQHECAMTMAVRLEVPQT